MIESLALDVLCDNKYNVFKVTQEDSSIHETLHELGF